MIRRELVVLLGGKAAPEQTESISLSRAGTRTAVDSYRVAKPRVTAAVSPYIRLGRGGAAPAVVTVEHAWR